MCTFITTDQIHKSHNAPVPYPTMHHSEQKCAHFCSEWGIVGYRSCIVGFVKICLFYKCHIHWHSFQNVSFEAMFVEFSNNNATVGSSYSSSGYFWTSPCPISSLKPLHGQMTFHNVPFRDAVPINSTTKLHSKELLLFIFLSQSWLEYVTEVPGNEVPIKLIMLWEDMTVNMADLYSYNIISLSRIKHDSQ